MKERLIIAAALGGVAVLAAVVFVVFQFGRVDPSPPSLIENPNPAIPGDIVYFDDAGCLVRAAASGATRSTVCAPNLRFPGNFGWVDTGTIAYWDGNNLIEVDLATGEQSVRPGVDATNVNFGERPGFSVNGETVIAEGGTLTVVGPNGEREKIASFDVGSRWIQPVLWSPDGNWIVVSWYPPHDQHAELWIVSRDGQVRGTLVDDGLSYAYEVGWWIDGIGGEPSLDDIVRTKRDPGGGTTVPVR